MVSVGTATEVSSGVTPTLALIRRGGSHRVRFATLVGTSPAPEELTLAILDPVQDRAPCALTVAISGGLPWDLITFSIDGDDIWDELADSEGAINEITIDIPGDLAAGTHTLVATPEYGSSAPAEQDFELLYEPLPVPTDSPDAQVEAVPDSEGRWVFQDLAPDGLGSWVMEYNPSSMTPPHFQREVTVRHTTSVNNGQFTASEGVFMARPWKISGTYLDEEYVLQLRRYAEIRRRFYIIDHRGRAWKVGVASLEIEHRRIPDWVGKWTMSLVIYDQTPSTPS